ncbi:6-bladed beta-propeller [Hydrogenimonas sp.]
MKKLIGSILLFSLVALPLLAGAKPVWPQPPETARIAYDKSITKAEDLEIRKGFFAKIWDFFAGGEEEILVKPFGIHVDDGKIFVTDAGLATLFIFDTDRNKMRTIQGFKSEKFVSPIDVTTDAKGNIYISDSVRKAVYIFNDRGIALRKIGSKSGLQRPTGIAIDNERQLLYITDTLASEIKRFTLKGKFLDAVGSKGSGKGELNRPTFITLDKEGNLYVCDSMNFRIKIYDKEGRFSKAFGKLGNTIGSFSSPRGIAVDKDGNIYVTDTLFNAVQIFDPEGNLLLVFGSKGRGPGEFFGPEDIAISKNGKAYVTDSYNMRIQVFDILSYNKNK